MATKNRMWWIPVKKTQLAVNGTIHVRWRATGLLDEKDEAYVRSLPEKTREMVMR